MNENLQKLAKKAGFELWDNEPWWPPGQVIDWSSDYDQELETLFKLIIRECSNFTKQPEMMYKHFGIKQK